MPNHVVHFAIQADDVQRAKTFYENAFEWTIEPWGPPGFFNIRTGEGGIMGALEKRTVPLSGTGTRAFVCTIAVAELDEAIVAIQRAGGTVGERHTIPSVGKLAQFSDTEGNVVMVMQYEPGVHP